MSKEPPSALGWVAFVSPSVGWGVDKSGGVVRTSDAGHTWHVAKRLAGRTRRALAQDAHERIQSGSGSNHVSFSFLSPTEAALSLLTRHTVIVLTTADAGRSWATGRFTVPVDTQGIAATFKRP